MNTLDWAYSISVIAVHILLAIILIRNWLSFHLRWTAVAVIARIFSDLVLLKQYDDNTYFWLFYAFQLVGSATFTIALAECTLLVRNWELSIAMLIYLAPELWQSGAFLTKHYALACHLADILRPINLACMVYVCSILVRRKGNPYAELRTLRAQASDAATYLQSRFGSKAAGPANQPKATCRS